MGSAAGVLQGLTVSVEKNGGPLGIVCWPLFDEAEMDWGDDMSDGSLNGDGAFYDLY